MSVFWNERVKNITPYIPGEQPQDRKYIKLNTNENPYPASPAVFAAIQKTTDEKLKLYPNPSCTELREAVAKRFDVKTSRVFTGNGSDEILAFAFAAFFNSGGCAGGGEKPLLFPDITYSFYPVYAKLWDVPFKQIPVKNDFSVDIDAYLEMILQGKSGGVIFANPNAPTGITLSIAELEKIAGALEKNRQALVLDEAYIAFADNAGSAIPLVNNFSNLLVVRTLSKEASLAGLRAGYAIGSEELIEGLCRIRDCFNSYTLDRLALAGAKAAIEDAPYYEGINRRVIATRRRVSGELESRGFKVLPSQANFIFASPPEKCGKTAQEFFTILREGGILVRHFNKPRIADYLRISIGTDEEMDAFLKASSEILKM